VAEAESLPAWVTSALLVKIEQQKQPKHQQKMDLKSKVALITGGTHGIGAETALRLAKEGVSVSLVARNQDSEELVKEIEAFGVKCVTLKADVSKPEECERVVNETIAALGDIDILVHSAGGATPGGLLTGAKDVWYQAFDIHVHAAFHLCHAAVPSMQKKNGGDIIFISSAAGLRGVKGALAYATVKGALPQFTRALAYELSDSNIKVNCVAPGVIRTRFQDFLKPEQVKNNIENRIPLHREGTPEDVADVIATLIKNGFITGENIVIDGGMSMRIC
jgi:NAD(P)-dependent dehydrogenase (short-subunit alcohol dehydrogenase family)